MRPERYVNAGQAVQTAGSLRSVEKVSSRTGDSSSSPNQYLQRPATAALSCWTQF